jgi:methanogenic corrinoid protein MtbC1
MGLRSGSMESKRPGNSEQDGERGGMHAPGDGRLPAHPEREHGRFIAELLRFRCFELADLCATHLLAEHAEIAGRYRPQPHQKWKDQFAGRIGDLAAALSVSSAETFSLQVEWSAVAFAARQVPLHDLVLSLQALAQTLSRELPPEDRAVVDSYINYAFDRLATQRGSPPTELSVRTKQGRLAAQYLLHLLEGDRGGATRLILDALVVEVDIYGVYLDVLIPAQRELGRMWHTGELSIAEEHFATETTKRVMSQVMCAAPKQTPNGKAVLLAAVEGNTHDLGIRVVGDFFELAGWRVVELGANMPVSDLLAAALDFRADVLAISATMPNQLTAVEDSITLIREELGPLNLAPKVIVGGPAFNACPDLWKSIGADGYATDAHGAVQLAGRLVGLI